MHLTNEILKKYVGGQLETQNIKKEHIFRGEIKSIFIEDNDLIVEFNWLAQGQFFPPIPKSWFKVERLNYVAGCEIWLQCSEMEGGRLYLGTRLVGEKIILYLPGDSISQELMESRGFFSTLVN